MLHDLIQPIIKNATLAQGVQVWTGIKTVNTPWHKINTSISLIYNSVLLYETISHSLVLTVDPCFCTVH